MNGVTSATDCDIASLVSGAGRLPTGDVPWLEAPVNSRCRVAQVTVSCHGAASVPRGGY